MELEHLREMNENRAFYRRLNKSRKEFQPRTTLCRNKDGEILGSNELILEMCIRDSLHSGPQKLNFLLSQLYLQEV